MNQLKQALIRVYDLEYDIIENSIMEQPAPTYPKGFSLKILSYKKISKHHYVHISRFTLRRTILITILVSAIFLSGITVMAMTRPEIFYDIQQRTTEWIYHFRHENPSQIEEKFSLMAPNTPKGYKVVYEDSSKTEQTVEYKDDNGNDIMYSQTNSRTLEMHVDAEYDKKTNIKINGYDAIVIKKDDAWLIMWNDGISVFELTGIAPYDVILRMAESVHN